MSKIVYDEAIEKKVDGIIKHLRMEMNETKSKYGLERDNLERKISKTTFRADEMYKVIQAIKAVRDLESKEYVAYEAIVQTLNYECLKYENIGLSYKNLGGIVAFFNDS